jgi:pimeloyl-ACP methyl ester carboxylesterase
MLSAPVIVPARTVRAHPAQGEVVAQWTHRHARVNGIRMHWVEQGEGVPVVLCHGFPHLWFSWRHQIPAIAAAGWRVIAPDMRGMGQTEAPSDVGAYGVDSITSDLLGLLDAIGAERAVFAGLDFGAFAIYDLAMRAPDRVIALIGLENPAAPHNPLTPPLAEYAAMARNHFVHIRYFEPYGPADTALNGNPREFLSKVFWALSGEYHYLDVWKHPPGTSYLAALPEPPPLPWRWLSDLELEFYVSEYSRSGFTGGLNWYRSMDLKWTQRQPYHGKTSTVPAWFIGSEQDCDLEGFHGPDPVALMRAQFPDLREVAMIPGAGHLVQMERPEEVNALLRRFLGEISRL